MKRRIVALVEVLILLIVFISCSGTGDVLPNVNATGLPAPTNVRVENGYVIWNPVEHVKKYTMDIYSDSTEIYYIGDPNKTL